MVKLILVNKNSVLKETIVKNFQEDMLYKKCNFRNANNFGKVNTYSLKHEGNDIFISVYAKNIGRANTENKYELPPPIIDKELYFGNMLILKHKDETITALNVQNLTQLEWEKIYEKLMGGFEDLNDEEEPSEEEEIPAEFLSKDGYSKEDGFVVDDEDEDEDIGIAEEEEEEAEEEEEEEEEEADYIPTNDTEDEYEEEDEEDYDTEYTDDDSDIGSELSEESYISDEGEESKEN